MFLAGSHFFIGLLPGLPREMLFSYLTWGAQFRHSRGGMNPLTSDGTFLKYM
jgi:hypothetical protein